MTNQSQQTAEEAMPQSAALTFIKRKAEVVGEGTQPEVKRSSRQPTMTKTSPVADTAEPKQPVTLRRAQPPFEPFSTRIRRDLKRQLKRLSHRREDEGIEVCTVQQFVDEALTTWLQQQPDREA